MNFLESLVAEWYEYSGYFVRSNPRARKRQKGGWDVELDVLAYASASQHLVHIETSSDANSWHERKDRFLKKKFILFHEEYESLIGSSVQSIEKIAIVGWSETKKDLNWGDNIRVQLIPLLFEEITKKLKKNFSIEAGYPRKLSSAACHTNDLSIQKDLKGVGTN